MADYLSLALLSFALTCIATLPWFGCGALVFGVSSGRMFHDGFSFYFPMVMRIGLFVSTLTSFCVAIFARRTTKWPTIVAIYSILCVLWSCLLTTSYSLIKQTPSINWHDIFMVIFNAPAGIFGSVCCVCFYARQKPRLLTAILCVFVLTAFLVLTVAFLGLIRRFWWNPLIDSRWEA